MLSNVSIKKFFEAGDIVIDPWDDGMMGPARVTLHLGERLLIPNRSAVIDVKNDKIPEYEEVSLTTENPFPLLPNQFVLGAIYEKIGLSEKIGMMVDGRNTISRLGLSITQTGMIVDTGQKPKTMTLQIKNGGPNTVLLYPKMKFCRAVFFLLDPPATFRWDTEGKYQANDPLRPIFKKEFED